MIQRKMRLVKRIFPATIAGCWLVCLMLAPAGAMTVQLGAVKDTMIFQNNVNNGAGGAPGLLAGTNSQPSIRRGMIAFDPSAIPANATITDVQLRLVIGQIAGSGGGGGGGGFSNPSIELHKLLVTWGEANTGASTSASLGGSAQGSPALAGDATWNARFFGSPSPWGQSGGQAGVDFVSAPSASLVQGNAVNDVSLWLSTPALIADVQGWLADPSSNNGWMLINANESASQTFRGFYSRNYNPVPAIPNLDTYLPQLFVSYTIVPEPSSMVLLAVGFGALVPLARIRSRRKSA
jgi:hypothetical protein